MAGWLRRLATRIDPELDQPAPDFVVPCHELRIVSGDLMVVRAQRRLPVPSPDALDLYSLRSRLASDIAMELLYKSFLRYSIEDHDGITKVTASVLVARPPEDMP